MTKRNWFPAFFDGERDDATDPFGAFPKQMEEMFEDFGKNLPMKSGGLSVRSNVSETEKEVCIAAELPGISMEDVDVSIDGNRISVSGEKVSEEKKKEDAGRRFRRVERMSGSFRPDMTMPFEIDPDGVKANAKDGVLTVTIPKPPEQVAKAKKIKIESSG